MIRMKATYSQLGAVAVLLLATLGGARQASAVLHAYEGFDYPNDSIAINGLNGGTGWLEGWNDGDGDYANLTNNDVSLSNAAFPFTPIGDHVMGGAQGSAAEVNRRVPVPFDMSQEGGVLYASLLFQKRQGTAATNNNVEFNFFSSDGNIQVARLGGTSTDQFFLHNATNVLPGNIMLDHTYFMVLKVTSFAASDDQFFAKIYDGSSPVSTAEPTTWDLTWGVNSTRIVDNIRLLRGASGSGGFDEIRVGTTWADVAVAGSAPTLTADFNNDLVVDGDDFLIWQRNYLATGDVPGDANDDGVVNELDLAAWKQQFGSLSTIAAASVPEPTSALLAAGAAVAMAAGARRRR